MPRTHSPIVHQRRSAIVDYVEANHPVTFREVLAFAQGSEAGASQGKPLPAMPIVESRQEHIVRSDLHKLRLDGSIKPSWVVCKTDW